MAPQGRLCCLGPGSAQFSGWDSQGAPFRVLGCTGGITARKKAEEALRDTEARPGLPEGWSTRSIPGWRGKERQSTCISAGVEVLHEVSATEVLQDASQICWQIVPEGLRGVARREEIATRALAAFRAEIRVRMPSGATRWRLFSSAPRSLPYDHMIWDGSDVTEARRR